MVTLDCLYRDRELDEVNETFCGDLVREMDKRFEQNPNLNILDVGCGKNGNCIEEIANFYPGAVAIGVDPEYQSENHRKSHCISGDLFHLPFRSEFDIIYSTFVFMYVGFSEDKGNNNATAEAVIEVSKALKPKGIAMISESRYTGTKGGFNDLVSKINDIQPDYLDKFQINVQGHGNYDYLRITNS